MTDLDLYENKNNEIFFYKEINNIKEQLINRSVTKVNVSDQYDVNIILDNGSCIDVFVNDDE